MRIKFVRDDQEVFAVDGSVKGTAPWGIIEVSGMGSIENTIRTEEPAVGDGEDVTGERVKDKHVDITASVKDRRRNGAERQAALRFFNPKRTFTVYVEKDGVTRWIAARIERFQCEPKRPDEHVSFQLALLCPDPYFYSVEDYGKDIASVRGTFGFPYASPIGEGFRVGIYNFARRIEIRNGGDVETYVEVEIKATGQVTNPQVMINGAHVKLLDVLQAGDVVRIDMVRNTIRKNGVNCIGKVDRKSSFSGMKLVVGKNVAGFEADDGDTKMKVFLYYNQRYMGV